MEPETFLFCALRAVQISVMLYATWVVFVFGRQAIPAVIEPVAILGALQYLRVAFAVVVEYNPGYRPDLSAWGLLLYDILIPAILARAISDKARRNGRWARPGTFFSLNRPW